MKKIILILIFFLAVFLRLYQLDRVPSGFHSDEAALGYNAYSILLTGKDEYGRKLPLVLQSFDDYKPAVYSYLALPAIKFLGLNEFATRLPSAIFGALSVVLLFFLAKKITGSDKVGLLSALLMAISPWHLDLSRATAEAVVALFFILLGWILFFYGRKRKELFIFFAFLSWVFSMLTYHAPRFFLPTILLFFLICFWLKLEKRVRFYSLLLLAVTIGASILITIGLGGSARIRQLSLFNNPQVRLLLEEQIREEPTGTNVLLTRAFHNKIINYSLGVLGNYGKYFTTDFFLLRGGEPLRVAVPNVGLLMLVELPFLMAGLYFLLRERKEWVYFIFLWILVAPLSASFTSDETPNVYRSLVMLPALNIATAFGFLKIKNIIAKMKRNLLLIFLLATGGFLFWNLFFYLHEYYIHQRVHQPWHRQYGYKELVLSLKELNTNYQKIFVTKAEGAPYIFFLFYQRYDPVHYQSLGSPRDYDFGGFDKYIFLPQKCPSQIKDFVSNEGKLLFVDKGECEDYPYAKVLKVVYREDRSPVFRLVEIDKNGAARYFEEQEKLKI